MKNLHLIPCEYWEPDVFSLRVETRENISTFLFNITWEIPACGARQGK